MVEAGIRVLVAESHPLIRRGLCALLDDEPDLDVVAETADAEAALALAAEHRPHVAVVDFHLENGECLRLLRELKGSRPPVPALVLSVCKTQESLRLALAAGACGYLLKDEAPRRIVEALRGAAAGEEGWLSREVAACLGEAWHEPLTPKELEVVHLLAEGQTAPDVAAALGIQVRTARNHLANIYSKLDLHSQPELVAWAWRSGLAGVR